MYFVERPGAEPAVLCVHGYCQSSAYWAPTLDRLAAAGARGLAPDLPGFGASAGAPGPYTMEAYADGLVALLDARGLERVALVGGSMGGVVAQHLALRYPDRVSGSSSSPPARRRPTRPPRSPGPTPWRRRRGTPRRSSRRGRVLSPAAPAETHEEYQRIALAASHRAAVEAARSNAGSRTLERLGEIRGADADHPGTS